jgi:hypothetical protein
VRPIDGLRLGRPKECHENQTEHIECRQRGDGDGEAEQRRLAVFGIQRHGQDLVLAEESAEWRHAAKRERCHQERPIGHRELLLQRAHPPDILFVMQRVNDRTGPEEEQGFEEGMGREVIHGLDRAADADGHHHVAELREG